MGLEQVLTGLSTHSCQMCDKLLCEFSQRHHGNGTHRRDGQAAAGCSPRTNVHSGLLPVMPLHSLSNLRSRHTQRHNLISSSQSWCCHLCRACTRLMPHICIKSRKLPTLKAHASKNLSVMHIHGTIITAQTMTDLHRSLLISLHPSHTSFSVGIEKPEPQEAVPRPNAPSPNCCEQLHKGNRSTVILRSIKPTGLCVSYHTEDTAKQILRII